MSDAMRVYTPDELGPDGYPPAWHDSIKHTVRERAGHRCVRCGHPYRNGAHGRGEWSPCDLQCAHGGPFRAFGEYDGEPLSLEHEASDPLILLRCGEASRVEAAWRILTVHHLDGDKANCRWWNLAALCQRCHLEIQGRVKMDQVYPWEHSRWFKPYAAGYYAATYLGEDLDRDETIARLDDLLGLERVA